MRWWPEQVPVFAIGGNITPHYNLGPFLEFDGPASNSDAVVSTSSSLHGVETNGKGGIREFSCRSNGPVIPSIDANCEHSQMLRDPDVQQQVVDIIQQYIDSLNSAGIADYVGTWHAHGSRLTINADGTGTTLWNAGPCPATLEATELCNGHAELSFAVQDEHLLVTYTSVSYTKPDGSEPPEGFVPPAEPQVGSTFTLTPVETNVLQTSTDGYYCTLEASQQWKYECNI